jgi:hypothetical protein
VVAKAPWALLTRWRGQRKWTVDPHDVWERWAGADTTWDMSPTAMTSGVHHLSDHVDESGARPR